MEEDSQHLPSFFLGYCNQRASVRHVFSCEIPKWASLGTVHGFLSGIWSPEGRTQTLALTRPSSPLGGWPTGAEDAHHTHLEPKVAKQAITCSQRDHLCPPSWQCAYVSYCCQHSRRGHARQAPVWRTCVMTSPYLIRWLGDPKADGPGQGQHYSLPRTSH